uniref:Uncharacterized protein n=1 Tax=Romanomermis culicivorax TaxID=13658 RepID=A0A915HIE8_ROMCU
MVHLRSQYDLWTLNHWGVVSDDLICKLGNTSRKFCAYETHDRKNLSRGLLFTFCLSKNDCDHRDVNFIGQSALQYANSMNNSENENLTRFNEHDPIVECVSSGRKIFGAGFWIMILITASLVVAFVTATVLQCSNASENV